jgi:Macrocin-O-methyltransferase (TylF)
MNTEGASYIMVSQGVSEQQSWDAYNDLLQRGTLDRITKILARYELFQKVIHLPGDIVECGVFKGTGVLYWAKLIQIFNPMSRRRVIGFGLFGKYGHTATNDYDRQSSEEFAKSADYTGVCPEQIMEIAVALNLDHRIELIQGDATATIKNYVQNNPGFRAALINLDFDVYDPTKAALEHLYDLVVPNGVIAFDEYAVRQWGESDAVDEFFRDREVVYQTLPWALSPTAFAVKAPGNRSPEPGWQMHVEHANV